MKTRNWLLFIFIGLIWGTSFLWIKIAVQEVTPFVLVGFRSLFAALGMLVYFSFDRRSRLPWKEIKPHLPVFAVLGLVNVTIPWLLFSWAEIHIESGIASILNATMPLWTIIIAPLVVSDDRITLPKLAGLATGFFGVVLMFLPALGEGWSKNVLGQAAILGATLCYASATIFARKKATGLNPPMQTFLQFSMSTLMIWPLTFLIEQQVILPKLPHDLAGTAVARSAGLGADLHHLFRPAAPHGPHPPFHGHLYSSHCRGAARHYLPGRAFSLAVHVRRPADPFGHLNSEPETERKTSNGIKEHPIDSRRIHFSGGFFKFGLPNDRESRIAASQKHH